MAKKVSVRLVDDFDGDEAADETVEFGIDGLSYEIDLTHAHAEKLRTQLDPWVQHARKVANRVSGRRTGSRRALGKEKLAAVRSWARAQGREVSDRGRVRASLIDEYEAAHRSK